MLLTRTLEVGLREAVLPEEMLRLAEELTRVDALLDDPVFVAPFVPFFGRRLGAGSRSTGAAATAGRRCAR
jgi:IS5 family transposase